MCFAVFKRLCHLGPLTALGNTVIPLSISSYQQLTKTCFRHNKVCHRHDHVLQWNVVALHYNRRFYQHHIVHGLVRIHFL